MIILPFSLDSFRNATCGIGCTTVAPLYSARVSSTYNNTHGYSATKVTFNGTSSGYQQIAFDFSTSETLTTGSRGNQIFYFPSGIIPYADYGYFNNSATNPNFIPIKTSSQYTTVIQVAIPDDSIMTLAYPLSYFPYQTNNTFFSSTPRQWFSWNFSATQALPVTIHYTEPKIADNFENLLFYSGILIGLGASIVSALAIELVKPQTWRPKVIGRPLQMAVGGESLNLPNASKSPPESDEPTLDNEPKKVALTIGMSSEETGTKLAQLFDEKVKALEAIRMAKSIDEKQIAFETLAMIETQISTIANAHEIFLLDSLNQAMGKLDKSIRTLNESSTAQLKATERLNASSDSLVYLTIFLMVLATLTLLDTFTNYLASFYQIEVVRSFLLILTAITIFAMAIYWAKFALSTFRHK